MRLRRSALPAALGLLLALVSGARPLRGEGESPPRVYLHFVSGDRLAGRLESIEKTRLAFEPDVSRGAVLEIDLDDLSRLETEFPARESKAPFEVQLAGGALLHAAYAGAEGDRMKFMLDGGEAVTIPRASVLAMTSRNPTVVAALQGERALAEREESALRQAIDAADGPVATVRTTTGDVLAGAATPVESGFRISGLAIEAVVRLDRVARIRFGAPTPVEIPDAETPPPDDAASRRLTFLETVAGMTLVGRNGVYSDGVFQLDLEGDSRVRYPLEWVRRVWFGESGGAGVRRVLVWGAFADPSDELQKTLEALKQGLPAGWEIEEDRSTSFDAEFARRLANAGALVIAEPERWGAVGVANGRDAQPHLARHLQSGGRIVVLGFTAPQIPFFAEAGLTSVRSVQGLSGQWLELNEEGRRRFPQLDGKVRLTNSTQAYDVADRDVVPLHGTATRTAIYERRIGHGRIYVWGADFYEADPTTLALLAAMLAGP